MRFRTFDRLWNPHLRLDLHFDRLDWAVFPLTLFLDVRSQIDVPVWFGLPIDRKSAVSSRNEWYLQPHSLFWVEHVLQEYVSRPLNFWSISRPHAEIVRGSVGVKISVSNSYMGAMRVEGASVRASFCIRAWRETLFRLVPEEKIKGLLNKAGF